MKKRKTLSLFFVLVIIITLLAGCGGNNSTDESTNPDTTASSSSQTTDTNENKTSNDVPTLEHRSWIYKFDDNNIITVAADYSADTGLVETFYFHIEIDKNYPDYKNMKAELQTYKLLIERENDPESIEYSYKENDDGSIVFDSKFYNLCADDRFSRAVLILRFTGLGYNDADEQLYYIDDMTEQLEEHGFSVQ